MAELQVLFYLPLLHRLACRLSLSFSGSGLLVGCQGWAGWQLLCFPALWIYGYIGLPPALFYGTGIPASILIINRDGADTRKAVLFINADHEYKEGKVQNTLRSEDIVTVFFVSMSNSAVESLCDEIEKAADELEGVIKIW